MSISTRSSGVVHTCGESERLNAVAGADGVVAVGLQQIVKELHVELVVLHDQDRLGHWPAPLPRCRKGQRRPVRTLRTRLGAMFKNLVRKCYGNANGSPATGASATGVNTMTDR